MSTDSNIELEKELVKQKKIVNKEVKKLKDLMEKKAEKDKRRQEKRKKLDSNLTQQPLTRSLNRRHLWEPGQQLNQIQTRKCKSNSGKIIVCTDSKSLSES
jgi:hypothetical protein